jgi:hypothetical protein
MRTMLRGKVTLLFMMLGMLIAIPAVALADVVVPDANTDVLAPGNQAGSATNPIDLGNVGPGATLTKAVSFELRCSGNRHADAGQTVNIDLDANNTTLPGGGAKSTTTASGATGNVSATSSAIGTIPTSWPDDTTGMPNCGATPPDPLQDNGNSTVTVTAPDVVNDPDGVDAPVHYDFKVTYKNSLTPTGASDAPSVTGAPVVFYRLTVVPQKAATSLSLAANPTTAFYSDNVDLTATLTKTSDSSGISGKTITFKEGTNSLGTAQTDANGEATLSKDNLSVGSHTIKAFFAEDDDYLASESNPVTVTINPWTLNGFYQPVDMNDTVNTVKNGSTVPVKFEILKGTTELTNTSAVTSVLARPMACGELSGDPEDPIETVTTGGTSLRYDTTGGQFIFNWQTPKGATQVGKCYSLTMTAADNSTTNNSTITAYFKLK